MFSRIKNFFLRKLNAQLEQSRKEILINGLKSCGKNIRLYMPICISGAKEVEIGEGVSIAPFVHIWGEGGIEIGNRVMIASHTAITSLTHDYTQEIMNTTQVKGRIKIGDDVWIGAHSVIMPGVSIGKGAVIGAGSVVTKDVEPYSISFGVPARHYQFREIENRPRYESKNR